MHDPTTSPTRPSALLFAAGPPEDEAVGALVVDPGPGRHRGLDGLRSLLTAVAARRPDAVRAVAARRRPEWNVLFPGTYPDAAPLTVIAATCSERRLHAESEQMFRVITAAAEAVVAAVSDHPLTVVVRHTGALDLPTLRSFPHLVERAALAGSRLRLVLADLDRTPDEADEAAREALALRHRILDALVARLEGIVLPGTPGAPSKPAATTGADSPGTSAARRGRIPEAAWYERLCQASTPEQAVAAALGVMRAAFFSTNHDEGVRAAHRLLAETVRAPGLDPERVRALLTPDVLGDDPGSLGVDATAVVDVAALRGLAHRYLGMTHVFLLDYRSALAHFAAAVDLGPAPVRARARLLRALLLIKRVGDVPAGFRDVAEGLAALEGDDSPVAAVEAAWLYNVKALGHVQLREAAEALAAERTAVRLVGRLSTTDATHLKVNLISNISVLREYGGQPDASLKVWRQFSERSLGWGDTFFKHHAYREGGLLVRAGRPEEAADRLRAACKLAEDSGDDFYPAHIALELGRLLLPDRPEEAAEWYGRAALHARRTGDPLLVALAATGTALARAGDEDPSAALREAGRPLAALTCPRDGSDALAAALARGSAEDALACLPSPRTKLNRPFHAVRYDLAAVR